MATINHASNKKKQAVPQQRVSWPGLLGLMLARVVILVGLLFILSLLLPGDSMAFYAFMALTYIISIPYALLIRSRGIPPSAVPLQFVVDLVIVTGLVYYTGGMQSDLTLLYPLVILSAGIITNPRHSVHVTVLSCLAYAILVVLMRQGILPYYGPPVAKESWMRVGEVMLLRIGVFACFGFASAYVSQRCQYTNRKLTHFREMAEVVFRNVRVGMMLLDQKGNILFVNERACLLLDRQEEDLVGCPLKSIVASGIVMLGKELRRNAVSTPCRFARADGSSFSVSFETSFVSLPGDAVPGMRQGNMVEVCIMVFSDISPIIEMKEQVERAERVRQQIELAAEMAHEIRNPLAAISGAAQLLQQLERGASKDPAEAALARERMRNCEIIVTESSRLDRIMERFIDHTQFSRDALTVKLRDSESAKA